MGAGLFQAGQAQEPQRVVGSNGEVCYSIYGASNCGGTYPYYNPFGGQGPGYAVRLPAPGSSPLAQGQDLQAYPPSAGYTAGAPASTPSGYPTAYGTPDGTASVGSTQAPILGGLPTAPLGQSQPSGGGQSYAGAPSGGATTSGVGPTDQGTTRDGRPRVAVAAPNFELSTLGGYTRSTDADSLDGGLAFVTGKLAVPLGDSFGAQIDDAFGVIDSDLTGMIGAHAFWRDPEVELAGVILHYSHGEDDPVDVSYLRPGVEGEIYGDQVKFYGNAGYQIGDGGVEDGLFCSLRLDFYPVDTVALNLGGRWAVDDGNVSAGVEFLPGFEFAPGLSLFAQGEVGTSDYVNIFGGLRYSFGSEANLRIRDRYYDPPNLSLDGLQQLILGKINNDRRNRNRGPNDQDCPDGQYVPPDSETGECEPVPECDEGYYFDTTANECLLIPDCDPNFVFDPNTGQCVLIPIECPEGQVQDPVTGLCVANSCPDDFDDCSTWCPPGEYWTGSACAVVPDCDPGEFFNTETGMCEPAIGDCPDGQYWNAMTGMCEANPDCPEGEVFNPETGACELISTDSPDGEIYNPDTGQCEIIDTDECPPGQVYNQDTGECSILVNCPEGQIYNPETEQCEQDPAACEDGTIYNSDTQMCDPVDISCPNGQVYDRDLMMCIEECQPGEVYDVDAMACVPVSCPDGQVYNSDTMMCEPAPLSCPPGQYAPPNGTGDVCVPYPDCPDGTFFRPDVEACVGGVALCEPPDVYDPTLEACVPAGNFCPPSYVFDYSTYSCVFDPGALECTPPFINIGGVCAPSVDCIPPNKVVGNACVGPDDGSCGPNLFLNPDTGLCEQPQMCPAGSVPDGMGGCMVVTCEYPNVLNGDVCTAPEGPCPPPSIEDTETGLCVLSEMQCPAGSIRDDEGNCVPI